MDKRKEANKRVKTSITNALFSLMHIKSLSNITITEIIKKANVARVSFYRNYTSKEDVLVTLVKDVLDDFRNTADYDLSLYYKKKHVIRCFEYFKRYKQYILDLYNSGFGSMFLEELNVFHESIAGTMPAGSPKRYEIYIYIGALYNTGITWLMEDQPASIEEVADIMIKYTDYSHVSV